MVSVRAAIFLILTISVAPGGRADSPTTLTEDERKSSTELFIAHQSQTQTYQADLRQTFHWFFPKKHVDSDGKLYYKAPDSLAMIFTKPVAESVIVVGDDLYTKRDKKSVVHKKLQWRDDGRPTQNVQFLLGFFQNGGTNYAKLFDSNVSRSADELRVLLVPKNRYQMLRSVDNAIVWPSLDVHAMRIGLIGDSYIRYEFS